ncbi:MAG: DUF1631 family protein [Pseudomonadales bacterium]|nr:DUF1631 family protein [Pseudomonadales bacterium]
MAIASDFKYVTLIESDDTVRLEKIRWSIRQRLRKQMLQLSADFFDEVDDFLFSGGQQGQFAKDSVYLKSMREIRAKQSLFEETFIKHAMSEIKASYRADVSNSHTSIETITQTSSNSLEKVEIDIALKAITRKGRKVYSALMKQIDSLNGNSRSSKRIKLIANDILLIATVAAFARSHGVFKVPLEVRLVFIKLFEKHFVMKLEKLFLDIISIVNNANDQNFVEKLYSSSSAFQTEITQIKQSQDRLQEQRTAVAERGAQKADIVESAVAQLISALCLQKDLPEFIDSMIRTKWRSVMFLIGLNQGTTSIEWTEAKHTVSMLTAAISSNLSVNKRDRTEIYIQLRQGFSMVQMEATEQENFMTELEQQFDTQTENFETCILVPDESPLENKDAPPEASISPTGEEIIDQSDLDEIAKLLGSETGDADTDEKEKDLEDLQTDIDQLGDKALVQYIVNGSYEDCVLIRAANNSQLYTVRNDSGFSLNRSRLGLAIALQNGELQIPGYKLAPNSHQNTLLPTSITRH